MTGELVRVLGDWLADVGENDPPAPVAHDGPCGERHAAPCGATGPVDLPAETLANGYVLCHLCGQTFRPGEPVLCDRRPIR